MSRRTVFAAKGGAAHKLTQREQGEAAFIKLQALLIRQISYAVTEVDGPGRSRELGAATVYDATYLALAELRGCEFWTVINDCSIK